MLEMKEYNPKFLGQFFTPTHIIDTMLCLIQSNKILKNPRFLEPSCGNGAFFRKLPTNKVGIEIDKNILHDFTPDDKVLNMDFFEFDIREKFDCIIGNPPYIRYQDILESTKQLLGPFKTLLDRRSNLYLFFIYKSILHLNHGGELIFITPRDFIKMTSSTKLNEFIFSQGTITHFFDLGDKKIFANAQPNCAIWRFEKNNFTKKTHCGKNFNCINGQIIFTENHYCIPFSSLFFVKVGAVSGADSIFSHKEFGNQDFVYSKTVQNGKTKRMIYGEYAKSCPFLQKFKDRLIQRRIKTFHHFNWWRWGREYYKSDKVRIYVNTKTRHKKPFFLHPCNAYDGSILAIFPRFATNDKLLQQIVYELNEVNWEELGFVCDGRFLFSQRSLENCLLDERFQRFIDKYKYKTCSL